MKRDIHMQGDLNIDDKCKEYGKELFQPLHLAN